MDRRRALAAIGALAAAACKKSPSVSGAWIDGPHPSAEIDRAAGAKINDWRDVTFPGGDAGAEGQRALILVPPGKDKPLLVALHGRGESGNGLQIGARAWPFEYELDRLVTRMKAPPLTPADLLDVVDANRLAHINASLADKSYEGMTIACPYAPYQSELEKEFGDFVIGTLIPRARLESSASSAREKTGIDGVSMGGRLALLVGLAHPEIFGVVGALQPAVKADEGPMWSALAQKAMAAHPVKLRLLTSTNDVFREPVVAIAAQLEKDGVPHELVIIPGDHGYTFNRGPGGVEMVYWHERMSRGLQG